MSNLSKLSFVSAVLSGAGCLLPWLYFFGYLN